MRRPILIILCLFISLCTYASDRYHINVLNEISAQQAKTYPKQWEISKYTYTNPQGISTTKYFLFAPSIKHNSSISVDRAKTLPYPWRVTINGMSYFADFDEGDQISVGDKGVLKYDGDRLYFYKE